MTNLSQGFLRGYPMRLETNASLIDLRSTLSTIKPDKKNQKTGWGAVTDGSQQLNQPDVTPSVTAPVILPEEQGRHPERLLARLFWFRMNRTLRRARGTGSDPATYYDLQAIDVVISPVEGAADTYTVVVSTWDDAEITKQAVSALKSAVGAIDDKATLISDTSVLDLITPDFFLWLLFRFFHDKKITSEIELDAMRQATSMGALRRTTVMAQGLDLSRSELLALVADENVSFGPLKLALIHDGLDVNIDFELRIDGAFSVTTGATFYTDDVDRNKFDERLREFFDAAYVVIPELKDAYQRDKKWNLTDRSDFRAQCRAELARRSVPRP